MTRLKTSYDLLLTITALSPFCLVNAKSNNVLCYLKQLIQQYYHTCHPYLLPYSPTSHALYLFWSYKEEIHSTNYIQPILLSNIHSTYHRIVVLWNRLALIQQLHDNQDVFCTGIYLIYQVIQQPKFIQMQHAIDMFPA